MFIRGMRVLELVFRNMSVVSAALTRGSHGLTGRINSKNVDAPYNLTKCKFYVNFQILSIFIYLFTGKEPS